MFYIGLVVDFNFKISSALQLLWFSFMTALLLKWPQNAGFQWAKWLLVTAVRVTEVMIPRATPCDTINPAPLSDPHTARTIISLMPKPVKCLQWQMCSCDTSDGTLVTPHQRILIFRLADGNFLRLHYAQSTFFSFLFFFPPKQSLCSPIHDFMWITSRSQITFCLHLQRKVLGCEGGRDEGMLRAVIEIKGSVFVESSQE